MLSLTLETVWWEMEDEVSPVTSRRGRLWKEEVDDEEQRVKVK